MTREERKEALDVLTDMANALQLIPTTRQGKVFKMVLQELQKPEQKWIPVSERLPERWQLVNITIKDYDESLLTGVGYYRGSDDGTWFITAGDGEFLAENEVIAWMPLPEPYIEGDEQNEDDN